MPNERRVPTAVLLLWGPDRRGLVSEVSRFVYENDGNVVHADQHVDPEGGVFLQRIEWELEGFAVPRDGIGAALSPLAERLGMRWALHFSDQRPSVALLVSRQLHCLHDLLARWRMGELEAELALVAGNHDDGRAVTESYGVPFVHLPVLPGARAEQEDAMLATLAAHRVELVVLARYMQILSERFIEARPGAIINIHHSFLPAFPGAKPYHQAHARGVKIIGATAHYATRELDQGPIIEQDVARVSHRDAVEDLVRKGRDLEKVVLARAVALHLGRRVIVYGNKTVVFD